MIRVAPLLSFAAVLTSFTAHAQDGDGQSASPPQTIDILFDTVPPDETIEDCSPQQEDAAAISGEIVVCRRISGNEHRLYSKDEAERRYARETMDQGTIPAPDVAGAGIFRGPTTVSGLCFIPPCPPPPAYIIDFSELPEPPPGSDADRIARGLPPLGTRDQAPAASAQEPTSADEQETQATEGGANRSVSASPAVAPSD